MIESLLRTKLYIPPLRPNLIPRPHLINLLNKGLQQGHKLTLVSAPAGLLLMFNHLTWSYFGLVGGGMYLGLAISLLFLLLLLLFWTPYVIVGVAIGIAVLVTLLFTNWIPE